MNWDYPITTKKMIITCLYQAPYLFDLLADFEAFLKFYALNHYDNTKITGNSTVGFAYYQHFPDHFLKLRQNIAINNPNNYDTQ